MAVFVCRGFSNSRVRPFSLGAGRYSVRISVGAELRGGGRVGYRVGGESQRRLGTGQCSLQPGGVVLPAGWQSHAGRELGWLWWHQGCPHQSHGSGCSVPGPLNTQPVVAAPGSASPGRVRQLPGSLRSVLICSAINNVTYGIALVISTSQNQKMK